jgi:hypothetical protein
VKKLLSLLLVLSVFACTVTVTGCSDTKKTEAAKPKTDGATPPKEKAG